jgi:hypothetical protein
MTRTLIEHKNYACSKAVSNACSKALSNACTITTLNNNKNTNRTQELQVPSEIRNSKYERKGEGPMEGQEVEV